MLSQKKKQLHAEIELTVPEKALWFFFPPRAASPTHKPAHFSIAQESTQYAQLNCHPAGGEIVFAVTESVMVNVCMLAFC